MYIHHTHDRRYKAREKARRRQSMAFRVQEGNRHAKVAKEKQDEVASATADNFALARQNREDELAYMAKQRAARRRRWTLLRALD